MSLMLGSRSVDAVVRCLNDAIKSGEERLSCFKGKAYKYRKPDDVKGEYIAVNHLPFVHSDAVGEGVVNINIHVPETITHDINTKRLELLTEIISSMFPEDTYIEPAYYEFMTDSRPTHDEDNTYYVNIQLKVTFNNLN